MKLRVACPALALLAIAACSSSSAESPPVVTAEGGVDASVGDSSPTEDSAVPTSDAGDGAAPAKTTALTATMMGMTRMLTRAQFGTQSSDAGAPQFHFEAHEGGDAACPTQSSPSPKYTLIVTNVPRGVASSSKADGVTSAFFDFLGDLDLPPLTRATAVQVTALTDDGASVPTWAAFDVTATFPEGTVTGHVYAEHCASLDD